MPSSISASHTDEQIIEFLLLCLENSGKTNFEEVAKQSTLARNATSAYKKLWDMKRKFRVQRGLTETPKSPTKVTKPRSPKPRSPKTKKVISSEGAEDE